MNRDGKAKVIGIDFDNTLISYDALFHDLAVQGGYVDPSTPPDKKAIRDAVRRAQGDLAWQELQGLAYGPRIGEARPAPGAKAFLARCREAGCPVLVISHKTPFASVDPTRTPMREAALGWLESQGFMPLEVRFGSTRQEKLAHIRAAGCTHFIDDLEETFREPSFPAGVQGILYAPAGGAPSDLPGLVVARSWPDITLRIFGA